MFLTYREIINKYSNPSYSITLLLKTIIKKNQTFIYSNLNNRLKKNEQKTFYKLLKKLNSGFPIEYIINNIEFYNIKLNLFYKCFIPRNETEQIINYFLNDNKLINRNVKILEMGIGSGNVILTLGYNRPSWKLIGIDISDNSIKNVKKNIKFLNINNITVYKSYWFNKIKDIYFDYIISNPPYLSINEYISNYKILKHEPINAFIQGLSGIEQYYTIIKESRNYLKKNGNLVLEIHEKILLIIELLLIRFNYKLKNIINDLSNKKRIIIAEYI